MKPGDSRRLDAKTRLPGRNAYCASRLSPTLAAARQLGSTLNLGTVSEVGITNVTATVTAWSEKGIVFPSQLHTEAATLWRSR